MDKKDLECIEEMESIINDADEGNTNSWDEDCAKYLEAIAKTQVLILKKLR